MVRILALDTCDSLGSVALVQDNILGQLELHPPSEDYSSWLLPAVKRLLASDQLDLSVIDIFAIAAGPGSFTGVRVGLTTVKAWSEVYRRPIAAVSRLQALAEEDSGHSEYVGSFFDARRGQIFAALYRRDSELLRVEDEAVIAPEEFLGWCARRVGNATINWISPQPACLTELAR